MKLSHNKQQNNSFKFSFNLTVCTTYECIPTLKSGCYIEKPNGYVNGPFSNKRSFF